MELKQIAETIEAQGKAWGEFQKTNDEIMKLKADGKSVTDLSAKLDLINADLNKFSATLADIEKKSGRLGAQSDLSEDQAEHKKAFNAFLRKGDVDGLRDIQKKAMNSLSDPDGGYLVLPEMDMAIDRVAPAISAMFRLANVVTIGSNQWKKVVKTSGLAMRRVDDGSTGGETDNPHYSEIKIDVFTAEVEPWVYNETLEDSFVNLEADLANEAAIGFSEGAGVEFISGNGVGKSRGITAYTNVANSSYTWGNVGYIASGAAGAFAASAPADRIVALQHSLKAQYRPGAVFLTNDSTLALMRQFKDGSGSYYLWNPDPSAGFGGRFLGSPVEIDDNIAAVGAGSFSLAYGNFKRGYTIVNRAGTTVIRDNITAKGKTKFNFRRRFGAGITNYEAIKLMRFATS
jgi:HK97 family phage major capsid protein